MTLNDCKLLEWSLYVTLINLNRWLVFTLTC